MPIDDIPLQKHFSEDEVGESESDDDTDESSGEQDHLDKGYRGEGFELWLEHVIAAKERTTSIAALEPTAATSDIVKGL